MCLPVCLGRSVCAPIDSLQWIRLSSSCAQTVRICWSTGYAKAKKGKENETPVYRRKDVRYTLSFLSPILKSWNKKDDRFHLLALGTSSVPVAVIFNVLLCLSLDLFFFFFGSFLPPISLIVLGKEAVLFPTTVSLPFLLFYVCSSLRSRDYIVARHSANHSDRKQLECRARPLQHHRLY